MNRRHFGMIFCFIAIGFGLILYISANRTIGKYKEIEELDRNLSFAASSAVFTLKNLYGESYYIDEVSREFFNAYNLNSFDQYSDLWNYVPGFLFLDIDGYRAGKVSDVTYKYMWDDIKPYELSYIAATGENVSVQVTLNDKITLIVGENLYSCEADILFATLSDLNSMSKYDKASRSAFYSILLSLGFNGLDYNPSDEASRIEALKEYERIKESAIATSVSRAMTDCINNHNKIMAGRGCTYEYVTPAFHDFDTTMPSFVVSFQGYPMKDGKYYSNLYTRGAYITNVTDYAGN